LRRQAAMRPWRRYARSPRADGSTNRRSPSWRRAERQVRAASRS